MPEYWHHLKDIFTIFLIANAVMLAIWPIYLLLERWSPVDDDLSWQNYWFNLKVSFFNLFIHPFFSAVIATFTLLVSASLGGPSFGYPLYTLAMGIPIIDSMIQALIMFLVACLITDTSYYWWHRWQHKIPALWEMHKVHHSDERLNMTTTPRSHFLEQSGQALVRGLSIGLIFDLNSPQQTTLAIVAISIGPVLWNFFIHSNVRFERLHRLLPFFSTPQYHRIHHSKLPQHQDCNFAIYWPFMDIIFGSYYQPTKDEYPPTGLQDGERIETMWEAQAGPLRVWYNNLLTKHKRPG